MTRPPGPQRNHAVPGWLDDAPTGGRPRVERISVLPETGLHPRSWTPLIRQIDADQADIDLGPHAMPRMIEMCFS